MGRPMIGLMPLYDDDKDSYWMLPGYMKAVEEAGGVPVMLPLTEDGGAIADIAAAFDGFLFTGGHDIHPARYGEATEEVCGMPCMERDAMEAALFQRVVELDKPAFGICRGLQLFNVLSGGTLYQDLPSQRASGIAHKQQPPYAKPVHQVMIEKGSLLHDILRTETLDVNSYHHQGIKQLSGKLSAVAKAEDGLVEAVEMRNRKFVLAVQWHPEFSYRSDPYQMRLFEQFVRCCQ